MILPFEGAALEADWELDKPCDAVTCPECQTKLARGDNRRKAEAAEVARQPATAAARNAKAASRQLEALTMSSAPSLTVYRPRMLGHRVEAYAG